MKKTTLRFFVDVLLFITMFGLLATGVIMVFFTASGPNVLESSKYFFQLHRHQWGNIHSYFALLSILLLVIHLILEWNWIKGKTRNLFGKVWVLFPILGLATLVLFSAWLFTPKNFSFNKEFKIVREVSGMELSTKENMTPQEKVRGKGLKSEKDCEERLNKGKYQSDNNETIVITGRLSLNDIQRETGIPAHRIAKGLKLPGNVSYRERLGVLKRKYSFTIQDLRELVYKLLKEGASE
jgi:hypothetical protein